MFSALLEFSGLPQIGFAHHFYYAGLHQGRYGKDEKTFELVYVKSGEIAFELYGRHCTVPAGGIFLLFRHLPVQIFCTGAHCSVQLSMDYELTLLEEEGSREDFPGIVLPVVIPPCAEAEAIKRELYSIVSQMNISRETAHFAASLAAAGILERINRFYRSGLSASQHAPSSLSYKIKKYIAGAMDKDIPLSDLAETLDKTPNYLNAVFKEANGITIHQYINREKVRVIAELMEDKGLSFKAACENVAITDVSYGYRLFKKHTGVTPGDYLAGKRYQE